MGFSFPFLKKKIPPQKCRTFAEKLYISYTEKKHIYPSLCPKQNSQFFFKNRNKKKIK
jgi:hypothetical protein